MDEESYRFELRNHFMGQMKNSKFQSTAQHYKDHVLRSQQKMQEFDPAFQSQRRTQSRTSGGDADRALYEANYNQQSGPDTYRGNHDPNYMRPMHCKPKPQPPAMPVPSSTQAHKFQPDDANVYMYETDSNIGGGGAGSEESGKSQKSSKTVVSKKSSQDLRKMVKSQCKLHEVIDQTLKQMCNAEPEPPSDGPECRIKEQQEKRSVTMPKSCKRCSEKIFARSSQKDVMTEISKGDFLECRSGDTLTITLDDVVNSKVVNPIIRKLQRMYLNNLREEMALMEDLERLPHRVNEVYKATIFKQKD